MRTTMMAKKELVYHQYEHGGARFYFETEPDRRDAMRSPTRDLIADVYQDEEFALYIKECIKKYFNINDEDNDDN